MSAGAARLLVGAPASGSGKTTFTCGFMHALVRRGLSVSACKCGPDYIDPLFHTEVIGAPSRNLDLFFSDESQVRALVSDSCASSDIVVIEGAMGYYDGVAVSDAASAWDVARATDTPAVLVVDGRGRARSIAAEVLGFARFRDNSQVKGVVLNRVSEMLYPRLKELVEGETGVRVYGHLPMLPDCSLESRHLGLVTAAEVEDLRAKLDRLADAMEHTVDIDGLLELAAIATSLEPDRSEGVAGGPMLKQSCFGEMSTGHFASCGTARGTPRHPLGATDTGLHEEGHAAQCHPERAERVEGSPSALAAVGATTRRPERTVDLGVEESLASRIAHDSVRIAVARDDAFCFYYEDTLRLLKALGAELVEFSPLVDAGLPEGVSGLYLGGGYPELHARELAENASMRESVAAAVRAGVPTIAECGGFLYLHEWLEGDDGASHPQVGVLPGRAYRTDRLGRFGYVALTAQHDGLLAAAGEQLRAHEFHYWDVDDPGDAFLAEKPQSARSWRCCVSTPALHAGFPHLYLPAHPQAAQRFVDACRAFVALNGKK